MTQKGSSFSTTLGHESQSVFELNIRGSKRRNSSGESVEEQESDSDVPSRKHTGYDGDYDIRGTGNTAAPGFLQRIFKSMSKSPLLRRPSGQSLGSYGALRGQVISTNDHSSDDEDDEHANVLRKRGSKGRVPDVFASFSADSSGSRQYECEEATSSQNRKRHESRGSSLAGILTEPGNTTGVIGGFPGSFPTSSNSVSEEDDDGEEVIDIDAESDKGSLENPLDNSPSVPNVVFPSLY